jgi:hypothetical protein
MRPGPRGPRSSNGCAVTWPNLGRERRLRAFRLTSFRASDGAESRSRRSGALTDGAHCTFTHRSAVTIRGGSVGAVDWAQRLPPRKRVSTGTSCSSESGAFAVVAGLRRPSFDAGEARRLSPRSGHASAARSCHAAARGTTPPGSSQPRFDAVMPLAVVYCQSAIDVSRTILWAARAACGSPPAAAGTATPATRRPRAS